MSEYIRPGKQLLVAVFGITTSLVTGYLLGTIEASFGFALYSYMLIFIVPVGSLLSGFVAASGYYAGAKLFHQKPVGGVLLNMVSASIGAFLIAHYIPYFWLKVDGVRVKEFISFWKYLDLDIRNTSLSFMRGGFTTGTLGNFWGYAYALLQLLGFSVGGASVFVYLSQNPYCNNCSRYLKEIGKQERYTSDGEALINQINNFASLVDAQKCNEAICLQAEKMGVEYSSGHHLRSRIITRLCPGCGINHLDFITSKLDGDSWKDIDETKIRLFTNEELKLI